MVEVNNSMGVPVRLTPAAIQRVRQLLAKQAKQNLKFRVGVKGGGCSGLSYTMTLDDASRDGDIVYNQEDIVVVVDPKSAKFLEDVVLDFSLANLLEGGWKWTNPHAARSCGCGTSFTPDR